MHDHILVLARKLPKGINSRTLVAAFLQDAQTHLGRLAARGLDLGDMTDQQAQEVLQNVKLVQVALAPMQDIKRMHATCLENDIPAAMERPCTSSG